MQPPRSSRRDPVLEWTSGFRRAWRLPQVPKNELPHRAPRQLRARSGTNDAPPGNQAIYNSSRPSGALVFRTVTCWMSKRQGLQKPGRNKTLLVKHFFQMHTRVLEGLKSACASFDVGTRHFWPATFAAQQNGHITSELCAPAPGERRIRHA